MNEATRKFFAWILEQVMREMLPWGYVSLTGSQTIGGATEWSDIDLLFVAKENSNISATAALFKMGFQIGLKTSNYGGPDFLKRQNPASGTVLGHRFLPVHVIMKNTIAHYNAHVLATREVREIVKKSPYFPTVMKRLKSTSPQDYYKHWDLLINKHYGLLTPDQKINPIE